MRRSNHMFGALGCFVLVIVLSGCAVGPTGPYYDVRQNYTESDGPLIVGPNDQNYVLGLDDRTPFGLQELPLSEDMLYDKGYDRVRRERGADFTIDIVFTHGVQENPDLRAANTLGGAAMGAAAGALIGAAAAGEPATGAAIGAASGGALGLLSPAATGLVRIDLTLYSFTESSTSEKSATVDLASVPPQDIQYVIDHEVSRMLRTLPRR